LQERYIPWRCTHSAKKEIFIAATGVSGKRIQIMSQIGAQPKAKKNLWEPVIDWVDPEVGLGYRKFWDCKV
jgi:hypothetical protein